MSTIEWQLTPHNFDQIDDQTDCDGVYAKGFWESIDGELIVTGLRIGSGENRIVAKFGDTITRHGKGTYTVRAATPAEMAAYRIKEGELAEQRHQHRDLDADSKCPLPAPRA